MNSRKLLTFFFTTLLISAAFNVYAVPACPDPFEAEHPDGGQRQFWLRGDEFFSWIEDADGFVYAEDQEAGRRRPQHATLEGKRLIPRRGGQGRMHRRDMSPAIQQITQEARAMMSPASSEGAPITSALALAMPPPQKLLTIVVAFNNIQPTSTASYWNNLFFGTSGKTVNSYYKAVSKNRFYFLPAEETQGTANDGIVYVTLNQSHPNSPGGNWNTATRQVARDAVTAAAPFINFASFDTNGDGIVSVDELNLVIILAGYEASWSGSSQPMVWAHSWTLGSTMYFNNVALRSDRRFAMQGERHGTSSNYNFAPIGTFCHELGHNIGLWDLYDTTNASYGVGVHCVMGYGSWGRASTDTTAGQTPTYMCAFNRYYLGFTAPKEVNSGSHTLLAASQATLSHEEVLRVNTSVPSEYFLIENRQLTGFDQGLQYAFGNTVTSGGIAIWHIDEAKYVSGANDNKNHKAVDLEEANMGLLGYSDLDTKMNQGRRQHYYYSGNVTSFTPTTTPSSATYNGATTHMIISTTSAPGANMTVHVSHTPTTLYVNNTRPDDTGLGFSWGAAKKSIQAAIDMSVPNDVILVANGSYRPISTANRPITIQSVNGASATIIDGGGTNLCAMLGSSSTDTNTVLTGFTLTNGYAQAFHGGGVRCGTLNSCMLTGNRTTSNGGGAFWSRLTNCTLTRNEAVNGNGGGACESTLHNCTVTENTAGDRGGGSYNCTLNNCIVWENSAPSDANYSSWCAFNFSCATPLPSAGPGNMSLPPIFIDAANGNYRLLANSPCIGAGDNQYVGVNVDLDGNPRIKNGIVCMGAYEFQGTVIGPTQGIPVALPVTWLIPRRQGATGLEDFARSQGANGYPVWESYVAGLNPMDATSKFTITNLVAQIHGGVTRLDWTPHRADRTYKVWGKTNLTDKTWHSPTNSATRFFKVSVDL